MVLADPALAGWDGFGLAVQAYRSAPPAVIDWACATAARARPALTVRLVKGAYWDTEIKRGAGAGDCRLPGLHPQADDRPVLHGLRAQAPCGASAALSAIRDPQRADCGERHRGGRRRRRLSSSSACTAWARSSTRRCARNFPMPPAASMRRSAVTATCSPIWCGGYWRTAPIRLSSPSPPILPCRSKCCCGVRGADRLGACCAHPKFPLPRDLYAPERRNSRGVEFGDRAGLAVSADEIGRRTPQPARAAPLIDGVVLSGKERARSLANRRGADRAGRRGRRRDRRRGHGGGAGRICRVVGNAGREARGDARTRRRPHGGRIAAG